MYSVNDELPEGFFEDQGRTRPKNTRNNSAKSGESSKHQYVIDNGGEDDEEMRARRHRLRMWIVAVALVFTVAALVAFGVALYFSSSVENLSDLEPVIADEP